MWWDEGLGAVSGGVDSTSDCESNVKEEFVKVAVLSWEGGIWNKGVGGGDDDGVWMSADVKNGFSTGWFWDTEEDLKC